MMYMSEKAMSPKTKPFRYLALAGNLLRLGWVVAWQMTLSPHPHLDNVTLAIVWAVPLLLPSISGATLRPRALMKQLDHCDLL